MAVGGNVGPDGKLDGTLSLNAYAIPTWSRSEFSGFPYAAGMISTEKSHSQQYGYWETAFRINNLDKGMHLAFWMLPKDGSWPPEVDILEIANTNGSDSENGKWHNNTFGGAVGMQYERVNNWQGWHKIGLEWTPTKLRWIYDGEVVREQTNFINKPMYFMASWELGGKWPGAPLTAGFEPGQVELDYLRVYKASAGAKQAGAPAGYVPTWSDDFNTPSVGTDPGDKLAPYFAGWNKRHLVGNNDKSIKVASDEVTASGKQTYGQALAATGLYGSSRTFHQYNKYAASPPAAPPPPSPPPASPPAPGPTTVKVVVSGDADGSAGNGGPQAKMALLIDGKQIGSQVTVTAKHELGQWQTLTFNTALDSTKPHQIGVKFLNDWSNWKSGIGVINGEDRNLYLDYVQVGSKAMQAEQGRFVNDGGVASAGSQLLSNNGTLNLTLSPGSASPPPPAPSPAPTTSAPAASGTTTLKVVASGDSDGGTASGGPSPKMAIVVDGVQVGSPVSVTASRDAGKWQTLSFDTGIDLSKADRIGVKFVNDWSNWKPGVGIINGEDRNLYVDYIQFGSKTIQAEQGKFAYASGGGAAGSQKLGSNGTLSFDLDTLVHQA